MYSGASRANTVSKYVYTVVDKEMLQGGFTEDKGYGQRI